MIKKPECTIDEVHDLNGKKYVNTQLRTTKAARSNIGMVTNSTKAASFAEQLQFDFNDTQTRLRSMSSDSSQSTDAPTSAGVLEPRDVTPPSQGALIKRA
jgi:hypothetical protein